MIAIWLGRSTRRFVLYQGILCMRPDGRKWISLELRILHDEGKPELLRFPRPGASSATIRLVETSITHNAFFR